MGFWQNWRAERVLRQRAARYVRSLQREPGEADVLWLARHGTTGDVDHARWELRYARRALGLVAAARDALDDRTASAVARELTASLARDPNVAAGMLHVAQRQLNARLREYSDALAHRQASRLARARLGQAILGFARPGGAPSEAEAEHAGDLLAVYLSEANEALRREFGVAALPEDVPPSAAPRPTTVDACRSFPRWAILMKNALGRTRTGTPLRARPPEDRVYTSFTTRALPSVRPDPFV